MFYVDDARLKYLSKLCADLGKNITTVAFASYFFEKFSLPLRFGLCIMGFILMFIGYIIQPSRKGA
jgi:hypothetical protein